MWTVPAERMKAGKEHRVPLSDPAMAVLDEARRLTGGQGLLFPSPRKPGSPLSNMTLLTLQKLAKSTAQYMVFAKEFRSWAEETGRDDHAAEQALAHTVGGVRGAYLRTTVFASASADGRVGRSGHRRGSHCRRSAPFGLKTAICRKQSRRSKGVDPPRRLYRRVRSGPK